PPASSNCTAPSGPCCATKCSKATSSRRRPHEAKGEGPPEGRRSGGGGRMKHLQLRVWQLGVLVVVFVLWHVLTAPGLLPNFVFDNDRQAAFFFGEPLKVFGRIWTWFVVNADIYHHLWITLLETVLAFAIGTAM